MKVEVQRKWYGYDHALRNGRFVVVEPLPLEGNQCQQITAARPGGLREHLRKLLAPRGRR